MSASAMSAMLQECTDDLPILTGRGHISEASTAVLESNDAYGDMLSKLPAISSEGEGTTVTVVNLFSILQAAFEQGGSYQELLLRTVHEHEGRPLNMVLYFDEIVPGDPVGYANKRKFWTCYAAFKEFGPEVLCNEACWIPLLELRTEQCSLLAAGISQVCKLILRDIFLSDRCDVKNSGLLLKSESGYLRLFIEFGFLVQDGAAHKMVFHTKGDKGTKMCLICRNLFAVETDIKDEETGETVMTANILYEHECDMATNDEIWGSMRRLKQQKEALEPGDFKKWQQAVGFNYEPHGLLLDESLESVIKPATNYMHDFMHCMFVGGIFQTVMQLFLAALVAALKQSWKAIYGQLYDYTQLWFHPVAKDTNHKLYEVFSPKRLEANKRSKSFKCKASDGLGLYPIIAIWIMTLILPGNLCVLECQAFLAMCELIDVMIECSRTKGKISPTHLGSKVHKFLSACEKAGWRSRLHPKFHWLLHFRKHLESHDFLIFCWVHERLHKVAKRYANDIKNTLCYEESLLKQVVCHTLANWRTPGLFDTGLGLKDPRKATKKALSFLSEAFGTDLGPDIVQTSTTARTMGGQLCSKTDVVLFTSSNIDSNFYDAGEVWLHAKVSNLYVSLVSSWELIEYDKPKGLAYWRKADKPMLIYTRDILCSVMYRHCKGSVVAAVVPRFVR
jgi:hypothetical protein